VSDRSKESRRVGPKFLLPPEPITPASPKPSLALTGERLELWNDIRAKFDLNQADMSLLRTACESLERAAQLAEQVNRDGATFKDRFGGQKVNPACQLERDFRGLAARVLQQLGQRLGD